MAVTASRKYNPGFLTDDELVASFRVRTSEFESIVEMLRECVGSSNPHQIVIGPRGSGKTSLLLRVAAEARRDAGLSSAFFPVIFSEESYEVATAGEFWLECLARLADQAPRREGDPDLRRTFEALRAIRDDRTLGDRCLGALLDFSDREGKRLVLMVENLNMMFGDMADPEAGWRLRKVLQTEPRIVLLASATSRFDEIDNPKRALYDLFRTLVLRPLDTNECAVLWEAVSGQRRPPETIRSLEILTGGSPRLLVIVARFGAELSFRDLMADLLNLIDDHTEYFKSHLESLPAQERRVYLALADLWKPALTKEIADRARLETSKCSAQLARLVERGAVQVAGGSARRKQYYLTERLYNIYYLLRRHREPDRLIEAFIRFMGSYYSPRELKDIGARILREAGDIGSEMRPLHRSAISRLMVELPDSMEYREELRAMAPPDFAEALDPVPALPDAVKPDRDRAGRFDEETDEHSGTAAARALFDKAVALGDRNQTEDALAAYDEVVRRFGKSDSPFVLDPIAKALVNRGALLGRMDRKEEALASWDEVARRFGESEAPALREGVAMALVNKGIAFGALNRPAEALVAYDEVVRRFGESEAPALRERVAKALVNRGALLGRMDRKEEALASWDEVARRFGESEAPALREGVAMALVNKWIAFGALNRPAEALAVCDEVVRRFGESEAPALREQVAKALVNKGIAFGALNRPAEALVAYDEVARRFGESEAPALREGVAMALVNKGIAFGALNRPAEALAVCDEVVRRFGESEAPALREQVAKALVNKGIAFGALNRPAEALVAYDEVARRFGESEAPALRERVTKALVNKGASLGALNRPAEALAAYDEVVRRFGESEAPVFREQVAKALVNKGISFGALNRPAEALAACDEVVRRFGESEAPALREQVAKALVNKGIALGMLNRPAEALAACDEVVRRFGESEAPALCEEVAKALVNRGALLDRMDRKEEALASWDEVARRFGESEAPALRERVATALVNKGAELLALNRPAEALAACDEVVRRFGESEAPALCEEVAKALVNRGALLDRMDRKEEALASWDEVARRFGESEAPALRKGVATALVNKGIAFGALNRPAEALAAYDEVVRRFGEHESPALRMPIECALIGKAELELGRGRYEAAIVTASRALDRSLTELPRNRWRGHLIRAKASLTGGDLSVCERDIEAMLAILPKLDPLSGEHLDALVKFSVEIGAERMRGLVQASPAANLLLALTTALEWELGLEPRVAREIEEIAKDIRRDLGKLKEARADGTG